MPATTSADALGELLGLHHGLDSQERDRERYKLALVAAAARTALPADPPTHRM